MNNENFDPYEGCDWLQCGKCCAGSLDNSVDDLDEEIPEEHKE